MTMLRRIRLAVTPAAALATLLTGGIAHAAPPAAAAPAPAPVAVPAPVAAPAPAVTVAPAPAPAPAAPEVVVVEQPKEEVVVVEQPHEPVVVVEQPEPKVVVVEQPEPKVVVVDDKDKAPVKVVINTKADDDDDDDEIIEEEVVEHSHHHRQQLRWAGLSMSTIWSPIPSNGTISETQGRLNQNKFRACLSPHGDKTCGYIKGFDFKVNVFESYGSKDYPTVVGYFRTGYAAGRVDMDPGSNAFQPGQVTSARYVSVPLWFGGNVYAFGNFPVRPYAGMGAGFDILRLDYRKAGANRQLDASGRIGFELHAGLEARISNFVSFHAEVMQLWSARRRLAGVPDVSTSGLSVLTGLTVAIPTNLRDYRRSDEHHTVRRTTVKKRR